MSFQKIESGQEEQAVLILNQGSGCLPLLWDLQGIALPVWKWPIDFLKAGSWYASVCLSLSVCVFVWVNFSQDFQSLFQTETRQSLSTDSSHLSSAWSHRFLLTLFFYPCVDILRFIKKIVHMMLRITATVSQPQRAGKGHTNLQTAPIASPSNVLVLLIPPPTSVSLLLKIKGRNLTKHLNVRKAN